MRPYHVVLLFVAVACVAVGVLHVASGVTASISGRLSSGSDGARPPEGAAGGTRAPSPRPGLDVWIVPRVRRAGTASREALARVSFEVVIANHTGADVYLLDDPALPGIEATGPSLTVRYDVEDFPAGADPDLAAFRVPAQVLLRDRAVVRRPVEIPNPVRARTWTGLHWDASTRPPSRRLEAPSVALAAPLTVKAVVAWGAAPFQAPSGATPRRARLAFLAWQRRSESAAMTVVR